MHLGNEKQGSLCPLFCEKGAFFFRKGAPQNSLAYGRIGLMDDRAY